MDRDAALKIIRQLANGTDPHTGELFDPASPYQHPDTVRALFLVLGELDAGRAGKPRPAGGENAPQNAGKPWPADEDLALVAAFDSGRQIPELAAAHGRSRFAIEARLAKLGKIAPPPNLRATKAAQASAPYRVQH